MDADRVPAAQHWGWQMDKLAGQTVRYGRTDEALSIRTELRGTATRTTTLDYDRRHQLVGASDDHGYEALLDYGPAGRLTSAFVTAPGAPRATGRNATYVYTDADSSASISDPEAVSRLDGPGGMPLARFQYDAAGNLVKRWKAAAGADPEQTLTFGYDGDLNQREATAGDGRRELYYYADGPQRTLVVTRSSSDAVSRVKLRFGPMEIWYTPDGRTSKMWTDVTMGGPIARIKNGRHIELQFNSQRGHLLVSLDDKLDVNGGFQYGAFGEILAEVGDPTEHLRRVNNKEQDQLTGLSYYGFRYYDPLSLTWTQSDPLFRFLPELRMEQPRNANLYVYTLNNPVRYVDPDGRFVFVVAVNTARAAVAACRSNAAACATAAAAALGTLTKSVMDIKGEGLAQGLHNGANAAGGTVNAVVGALTSSAMATAQAALQAEQESGDTNDSGGDGGQSESSDDTNQSSSASKPKIKAKDRRAKERGNKQKNGTPGNNRAQNKQFGDATRGLTKDQKAKIHRQISGKNLSYKEIKALADELKAQ